MSTAEDEASASAGEAPAPVSPADQRRLPPQNVTRKSRLKGFLRHLAELPMLVLIAFAIAILIKTFLVQAFFIPSGSMLPTLKVGDRVLVEKVSYALHDPRRGDVVVFEKSVFGATRDLPWHQDARNFLRELLGLPTGGAEDYIKRVVAVAGDTIRYSGTPRTLVVNGDEVDQTFVRGGRDRFSSSITKGDCERLQMERAGNACRVPAGRIFVMGDNRAHSEDSRILGPVDKDKVVGKAFVIIWPPRDFRSL